MSSALRLVDDLLSEFYQPMTSNARKRAIETELMTFKNLPNSWQLCLRVATSFETNQFLWFFCTSTVEHAITKRWPHLSIGDRATLRETLWTTYANLSMASNVTRSQRETFAQLIAMMGKREFCDENPNYMHNCIGLIKTNFELGIALLRTTSEEVVNNRDGVNSDRRKYFVSCMSVVMPEVMELITKLLLIALCHLNGKNVHSIPSALFDYTLLPLLPIESNLGTLLVELLSCTQHLISWIPTDLVSEYFLLSILDLSQWRSDHSYVSLAALCVLIELLYSQKTVLYVNTLMNGINGLLNQHNALSCRNEMYDDKFRELLRLYTTKYWTKLLHDDEQLELFLKSLFCFTTAKNGALDFTEKLESWTPIVKGMVMTSKYNRYCDLLYELAAEIMRRTRFDMNKSELELLDNETIDDNLQTEWQQYLTQCFECVALVAEARPHFVFEQVYSHWTRPYTFFMSLKSSLDNDRRSDFADKIRSHNVSEQVRDLSSICQALVRIAPLLEGNTPTSATDVYCHTTLLAENLLATLDIFHVDKFNVLCTERNDLKSDITELYAQILMALRSLLPITATLRCEQKMKLLIEAVTTIFLTCPLYTQPPIVHLAASELLLCITSVIRPKYLFEIAAVQSLYQTGSHLPHLPKEVIANIHKSLVAYLLLPWKNVNEQQQDFAQRRTLLQSYFNSVARNFLELNESFAMSSLKSKVCPVTVDLLPILKIVIDFFKDTNNTSKEMLSSTLKPIIMKSLGIYDEYGAESCEISMAIADFCLSILRTLQNQLGAAFVNDMISLFVTINSGDHLTNDRVIIIEKILKMFQLIIEQPGNSSMSMLPTILNFTIRNILPILHQDYVTDKTDILYTTYSLFDSVLKCKWQYFYKPLIQYNGTVPEQSENQHAEQFMAILTAYGEVLVASHDPNAVQMVLESLQSVNDKWHLYNRSLFKESLLASYLGALLRILFARDVPLNYELLVTTLFTMGQVDTTQLRSAFLAMGHPADLNIQELCMSTDIPTFSQKLTQVIQDTRCRASISETL